MMKEIGNARREYRKNEGQAQPNAEDAKEERKGIIELKERKSH